MHFLIITFMFKTVDIKSTCLSVCLALLAAVGLIFYNKAVIAQGAESYVAIAFASVKALASLKVLLVVAIFALLIYVCLTQGEKVSKFVFKYRFLLCAIVFAVLVGFGISGSSIGMWSIFAGEEQTGLLAGVSREIRGDEYNVSTAMALSQYADATGPFQYFSNVVRGTSTDVFLEYGQPVFDIVEIFRPFHWGYLFLPPAQGLSFFWFGRLIALFIVSFEFGRLLTKDKRHLALIYACLVTFAPVVQWWFAVNGIVEILVYAQLATLAFREFFLANGNIFKRIASVAVICVSVGGYALTLYPPWQIPIAYVILALEIWVFMTYCKQSKFKMKEVIGCACCVAVFSIIFARVFILSNDTIITIMNTAYPGARVLHGGDAGIYLFKYVSDIFFPLKSDAIAPNVCEAATFIDFFPISVILPVFVMLKKRCKDLLSIFLLIIVAFFDLYVAIGYPAIIEKITLLNQCQTARIAAIVGFPNIILLIRSLSLLETTNHVKSIAIAVAFALFAGLLAQLATPEFVTMKMAFLIAVIFGVISFLLLANKAFKKTCVISAIAIMLVAGGLVNPIQKGLDCVYEQPAYKLVKEVHETDTSALWVAEPSNISSNLLITAGAPTVNSTNVYPNLERWHSVDENYESEEIYNRYAHIALTLKKDGDAEFTLASPDAFHVNLTPADAKKIGVKYVFTTNNLEETLGSSSVSLVSQTGVYRVYELL